jgi:hypothetical protein
MKTSDKLCDRVIHAIGRNTDPLDALNALADALGYQLSLIVCPDCRAQAARAFGECIPKLLQHADEAAAEYAMVRGDAGGHPHAHLSH